MLQQAVARSGSQLATAHTGVLKPLYVTVFFSMHKMIVLKLSTGLRRDVLHTLDIGRGLVTTGIF